MAVWLLSSKDVGDEPSKDAAEPANAAGSGSGSFSRLTHAAEFYASQAATQAAGLLSYKTGDEKSQERFPRRGVFVIWMRKILFKIHDFWKS